MSVQERAPVPAMAEQDPAPVVDEARDVHRPLRLGDLLEDRSEEVVKDDLAVERDDEVVDRRPGVEIGGLNLLRRSDRPLLTGRRGVSAAHGTLSSASVPSVRPRRPRRRGGPVRSRPTARGRGHG